MTTAKKYYGVVVFLDRLGTRGIWQREDAGQVIEHYKKFADYLATSYEVHDPLLLALKEVISIEPVAKVSVFSDTIIATTGVEIKDKKDLPFDVIFFGMGASLGMMIRRAMIERIYLRGAMSLGEYYRLDNFVIGPAIDEAAQYYSLPNWIGISAAPSAHYFLSYGTKRVLNPREWFTSYDIPLRVGIERNGWAVNWAAGLTKKDDRFAAEHLKKVLYEIEKGVQNSDFDIAMKWRNTSEFLSFVLEKEKSKSSE